jgi:hypothetical protein
MRVTLKPRWSSRGGLLIARHLVDAAAGMHRERAEGLPRGARVVMHKFPKEEALIWATIFAVVLIAVGSTYACSGPTYVLQSIAG